MAVNWIILSDFDGTITREDASQLVLSRYAKGDWKKYDRMFARGDLGFEDCVSRQFAMIRASKSTILRDYALFVSQRDGFRSLIEFATAKRVPVTIVSGGLEFIVREFLARNGWDGLIKTHMGKLRYGRRGMTISFPSLKHGGSVCFKDDLVRQLKSDGIQVAYMGDGTSDLHAALASDIAFAVRGSKLAKLCLERGTAIQEFDDFEEVLGTLAHLLG